MAEAGPSRSAPLYGIPVPVTELVGVEYPARVTHLDRALASLGGLAQLSSKLAKTVPEHPVLPEHTIEYALNPLSPFAHPVSASVLHSGNVVLRIIKRRRKNPKRDKDGKVVELGVFSAEVAGLATKTVRFRAMADFQHHYKGRDSVIQLTEAIRKMDVEGVTKFEFDKPNEDFTRDSFIPPPVFSRQIAPQMWNLKPVNKSVRTTSLRANGEEVERYINISRWRGKVQQAVSFDDRLVPQGPADKPSTDPRALAIEAKLLALLDERPMWTRTALVNQLDEIDTKFVVNGKQTIPMVCYTFSDGPFRDLCIRFGYDPRLHPDARLLQHVVLRNVANTRSKAPVNAPHSSSARGAPARQQLVESDPGRKLTHTFDGKSAHSNIGNFQLCDVSDPLLANLIHAPAARGTECSGAMHGWFDYNHYEQIRQVLRRKFIGIHQGHIVTDDDCSDLLGDPAKSSKQPGRPRDSSRKQSTPAGAASASDRNSEQPQEHTDPDGSAPPESEAGGQRDAREDSQPMDVEDEVPAGAGRSLSKRKYTRAPWEGKKKKNVGPKKPKAPETHEEMADRLRKAIGEGNLARKAGASADAASQAEGEGEREGQSEAGGEDEPME